VLVNILFINSLFNVINSLFNVYQYLVYIDPSTVCISTTLSFNTMFISTPWCLKFSYKSQTFQVTVDDGAAVVVNITLTPLSNRAWSMTRDFDLKDNVDPVDYASVDSMTDEVSKLAADHPDLIDISSYTAEAGRQLRVIQVTSNQTLRSNDTQKVNFALIGRLRASEPVGTEIVLRFLRHLVSGLCFRSSYFIFFWFLF